MEGEDGDGNADPSVDRDHEVSLDIRARFRQELAHPGVVTFHVNLINHCSTNNPGLNTALGAYLSRVVGVRQLGLEALLYNVHVLRVMHVVLGDKKLRDRGDC